MEFQELLEVADDMLDKTITINRYKRLLNNLINDRYHWDGPADTIEWLLRNGFEREELVNEFDFTKKDFEEFEEVNNG